MLLPSVLVACSTSTPQAVQQDSGYVLTVPLKGSESQSEVLEQYGGEAVVWRPEAGFAILKLSAEEKAKLKGEISAQAETNSTLSAPEVMASSLSVWGGGVDLWGGGWNTWAGGWNTWAGGSTIPALPGENRHAWMRITLPQAFALSKNYGAGMKVAVIDTGLDTAHPMFSGRLASSSEWKDFVGNDTNPQEVSGGNAYGHGTAVAGLILQIAPRAKILPIRALRPDGSGDVASVAAAIDWAVQKNARIINLSLGTNVDVTALKTAVNYATSLGIYVVASAGNEGSTNSITYPAAYATTVTNEKYLISVGSTQGNSSMSTFSNRSAALEIAAPGENMYTAYPGSQIVSATGTSFAAPLICGMIALLASETASSNFGVLEAMLVNNSWTMSGGGQHANTIASVMNLPDFQWNKTILFVVGNTTLNSGDTAAQDALWSMGYNVTLKTGASVTTADATGKTAVIVSSTVNSTDVGTKFKNVAVPVITWEVGLFDDLGMVTASSGYSGTTTAQTSMTLLNPGHPLSAGITPTSSTGQVFSVADTITWGKPSASAIKIGTLTTDPSKATLFAYDTGALMVGMTAPARRVALPFTDTSASNIINYWTSDWYFKAAVIWAISGN